MVMLCVTTKLTFSDHFFGLKSQIGVLLDISFQWCVGQFWGLCVWWLVGHFPLFGGAPSTGATNHQHQQGPAGDRSRCSGREACNRNAAPLEETLRKVVLAAGRLAQLPGAAAGLWWRCTRSSTWWESLREGWWWWCPAQESAGLGGKTVTGPRAGAGGGGGPWACTPPRHSSRRQSMQPAGGIT